MFCAVLMTSGTERLPLRTKPGGVVGDPRGKADTCVQVNCPPSPLARFLVPFFRAEKRNCPPHRRKGIVRRGVGASKERLNFSLFRLQKFIVCAHAANGELFFLLFHSSFFDDPALSGESEIFSFFSLRSCRAGSYFLLFHKK